MGCATILGLAVVASPTATSTPARKFDLECTGTVSRYKAGSRTVAPFRQVIRVDLDRMEYCRDACDGLERIQAPDTFTITLIDRRSAPVGQSVRTAIVAESNVQTIDRRSGALKISQINARELETLGVEATCEARPFTPFPSTKF